VVAPFADTWQLRANGALEVQGARKSKSVWFSEMVAPSTSQSAERRRVPGGATCWGT
jgi:hypothetical protein